MEKQRMIRNQSEAGLTLVEVIASIVIFMIVLSVVFMIFTQSAKTTHTSEATIDATYLAQTEMEKAYTSSETETLASWKQGLSTFKVGTEEGWDVYEKEVKENMRIVIKLKQSEQNESMTRVLIFVYEGAAEKPSAQMESLYHWGDKP